MKNTLKFIASLSCYVLLVPCVLISSVFLTWYVLPAFQTTLLGILFGDFIGKDVMLLASIVVCALTIVCFIFGKLFNTVKSSKVLNFYTHIVTWSVALALAAESVYSFIASDTIHAAEIQLDQSRKIGILSCGVAMLLYAILAPKLRVLVNRRIQAYDTAKELNLNGRSSVVGMQILKCFDFVCPELFLLIALCFSFSWSISIFFVFIICSFILPIVGNMICDRRVKKEAIRRDIEKQDAYVAATAEAVADILQKNGENN